MTKWEGCPARLIQQMNLMVQTPTPDPDRYMLRSRRPSSGLGNTNNPSLEQETAEDFAKVRFAKRDKKKCYQKENLFRLYLLSLGKTQQNNKWFLVVGPLRGDQTPWTSKKTHFIFITGKMDQKNMNL